MWPTCVWLVWWPACWPRGNRGLVFHGEDGLDELTTTTRSDIYLIKGSGVEGELDPTELGLRAARPADLVGGLPAHNAQVVRDVFAEQRGRCTTSCC